MKPFEYTGNSANLYFYRERDAKPDEPYVWAETLYSGITKVDGEIVAKRIPDYYVRVIRNGVGEVASFKYTPKTKPKNSRLPPRTVAKLVREHLGT